MNNKNVSKIQSFEINHYTQHNEIVAIADSKVHYYFPNQAHLGLMTSAQLRFIADELDRLNSQVLDACYIGDQR